MGAVVFPGPGAVEELIIPLDQRLTSGRVFPDPVAEGVLDCLLLLLGKGCFFAVEHTALLAVRVLYRVVDPNVAQIKSVLENLVGIRPGCAVGYVGRHVVVIAGGLRSDAPLRRQR